jgi:hypothetical protein
MMKENNRYSRKQLALIGLMLVALGGGAFFGRPLWQRLIFHGAGNHDSRVSSVRVTYITRYQKCDDTSAVSEDIDQGGLESFLASLSEDWNAMGESSETVQLLKVVNDWCPNHKNYRLIKIQGGNVRVFRGQSADERHIVYDLKALTESSIIHQETQDKLRLGVVLFDEDPGNLDTLVKSYLEGITD